MENSQTLLVIDLQKSKLSSKQQLNDLCKQAFQYRKYSVKHLPEPIVSKTSKALSVSTQETRECIHALGQLFKAALFDGSTNLQDIYSLFSGNFHKNLRDLLATIIRDNMEHWKTEAVNNQGTVPRMVDFDWRVDTKTSSDAVARMAVPTCILSLQIQESPVHVSKTPDQACVNVELGKETLDTMLDGLGKIRDQLASVAKR